MFGDPTLIAHMVKVKDSYASTRCMKKLISAMLPDAAHEEHTRRHRIRVRDVRRTSTGMDRDELCAMARM